jgi:two-component system, cell cycle response regulator DivK
MNTPTRVLLVEDNADNRYLATLLMEDKGYVVRGVATGGQALAAVAEEKFAFVLLDLQLPDIDGFEVARRIRETIPAEELPIIAVSAFAMSTDRKKAFDAGCNGYLEKPIDADSFVAQVNCQVGLVSLP